MITGESDDAHLIKLALDGDIIAFKRLVERYEGQVAGIVKSMLGECAEASDVGQEVFIRFYQSMEKFKGESGLGTYLGRIAINLSLNELKRRKKSEGIFRSLTPDEDSKADETDENELLNRLRHEITHLDPEFRTVIALRLIEGYNTEETATILNLPQGTVLSRLYRAQKKLKDVFLKNKIS